MLRGSINHLDLTVSSLEAAEPFYEAVLSYLGFERICIVGDDATIWHSTVKDQRLFSIALRRPSPEGARRRHDRYSPGLHHLAFHAASRDDVNSLYERLKSIGATILDPPAEYPQYAPGYYAVFFADPDGLKLEFVHMPNPAVVAAQPGAV